MDESHKRFTKRSGVKSKRRKLSPRELKEFRERSDRMAQGMVDSINKRSKET